MTRKERFQAFLHHFTVRHPEPETELHYESPYQLMVAVILSAQCTDKRVNMTTPAFFERFPGPEALKDAEQQEVYEYIKSISYPNNKAKHLRGMAKMLVEDFGGEIPADVKELQKLPGVGRKTANVIASVVYHQPTLAVDTHVFRVSKRLGLVNKNSKTPRQVEDQLVRHIPEDLIPKAHHWLILHGRYICLARNPQCKRCELTHLCKYYETKVDPSGEE